MAKWILPGITYLEELGSTYDVISFLGCFINQFVCVCGLLDE